MKELRNYFKKADDIIDRAYCNADSKQVLKIKNKMLIIEIINNMQKKQLFDEL